MGLGDLLNFDFGMNEWGEPLWNGGWDDALSLEPLDFGGTEIPLTLGNLDTGGVSDPMFVGSLDGGMPSPQTLASLESAASPNNADAIARMQADVAAGRAPNPQDLRTMYSNWGIPYSNADVGGLPGTKGGLGDMLRNLLGGGSGDGAGGGGNLGVVMPKLDVGAPNVGAVSPTTQAQPQGSLMSGAAAPAAFTPMALDTRGAPAPERRGLDSVFERDPFADVKARLYGGR